ncbi:TonB-dependent receptor family protein [Allomesorhizobium camelthorni]|uniref:TonB-dependent receptor plug domain-containing protein n=1 Tax=Allomesorhizobium camelthorni TaxID=475069 RepID=A0A6G4WMK8_9HYPH|nr:TonB-dependent receptor plug domain-containing protein [Mesorhizobium camelthorni]NGO56001.1 TonB-dependent receptor plug domain-containing protein [Mesorhizobium camelthorni]
MYHTRTAAKAALLVSTSFFPAFGLAQEADPGGVTVLDTISITGNWLDQPNQETALKHPGARTILDRDTFETRGASDVRDALNMVPGVQVQESSGTGGSDISLNLGVRGLTSRLSPRSTVLMDGVPLSYAPYGQPQLSLFPLTLGNVETIDVVRGAGSVRYGPQNVGGIINFVTRPIPDEWTARFASGAEIAGNNGHVKATPNLLIGGTNANGLGAAILYSGVHGQGYRDSNDRTDIDDLILKGSYDFSDTDSLNIQFHHYDGEGRMPGGLTAAEYAEDPFQSTRRYDEFSGRRDDISLRYHHDDGVNDFELLTYYVNSFRSSHIEQQGTADKAGRYRLTAAPRNYEYFAIEPRYSRLFELGSTTHEVTVGYRYHWEESSEIAARTDFYDRSSSINPERLVSNAYQTSDGGTIAHAFYIDDKIEIGNWTVTPGVRYELINTHNNITLSRRSCPDRTRRHALSSLRRGFCRRCSSVTKGGRTSASDPGLARRPGRNRAVPLQPAFVDPQDGAEKQDCESRPCRRWLAAHGSWPMRTSGRSISAMTFIPVSRSATPCGRPRGISCSCASPNPIRR